VKSIRNGLATLVLLSGVLALTSCKSGLEGNEQTTMLETPDGAAIVDTVKVDATVSAIDGPKRKVTLTQPDGRHTTVKCGPEVANFNQLQINDRVKATITEELAVFLGKGAPPSAAGAAAVALAPVGAKPGGVVADTVEITAKVVSVDSAKRKVTLELPDGSMKTVKAGKKVDLSGTKPGDNVTVQHTESVAITVEKP
jgi:hypothetical protein